MARPSRKTDPESPWSNPAERERERLAKREAVLRTAARLFNAHGYHATSLDEVATALHVTKPTIYHYFANKDEILFECTRRGLDTIAGAARDAADQGGTAMERLQALLMAYALCMMDDYGICVARTQDSQLSPESRVRFRALKREIDGHLRQVLADGVAEGVLTVPDLRIAAFTAASALNGLGSWFRPDGPQSTEEAARLTVATLIGGLARKKV